MRVCLPLLLLSVLVGCPDPGAPSDGTPEGAGAGGPGGGPPPEGAGGPGGPAGPGAGGPGGPPAAQKFDVKAGEGVKLSGTLSYAGSQTGAIHVDFLKPGDNGSFPVLLDSIAIEKAGPWEIEAPKGLGKIGVVGYVDVAGDGPNAGDPAARVAGLVEVGTDPVSGLDLVLSDTPDLGEFTPGKGDMGPPPGGAGGPPPGGAAAGEGAPPAGGAAPSAEPAAGTAPAAPQ